MAEKAKAMVLGSFLGDSFSLGVHWIYDVNRIKKEFGRVETLLKPLPDSYHPTKDRGELTHYGDQAMVLLESVSAIGRFDLEDFSSRWRALFKDYHGYLDQATKVTLQNFASGKSTRDAGSSSSDLAGAARIAPLAFLLKDKQEALVEAAGAQTRMTHNNPLVIASAEFFGRVCSKALRGASPASAMSSVAAENYGTSSLSGWVKKGIESRCKDSISAIAEFGQSCHVEQAFPGAVHLISKYENDFKEALIQCAISGGDSAARGMVVGMVLGAHLGEGHLPQEWVRLLKKGKAITRLLDKIS
jgi:ADP-ribosylglycohydrolase